MSKRRGYEDEYHVKKQLVKAFGAHNVLKVAVSQKAPDFIVLRSKCKSLGPFAVEVKGRVEGKFKPNKHDLEQYAQFCDWSNLSEVQIDYYIVTREKNGKSNKVNIERITLGEFREKYIKG